MNNRTPLKVIVSILLISSFFSSTVNACGVSWDVPRDHFNGVNEQGYVSYWDKIGDLDLGNGIKFPLIIGFQSDRDRSSPYLGYGWIMPLLESSIVQTGPDSFEMLKPGGYTSRFARDAKNPELIYGVQGWKGEIKGDIIKALAPCGWALTFEKGRLISMSTPNNKVLQIKRDSAGVVTEIREGNRQVLGIERDPANQVAGFVLGEKHLRLEMVDKVRLQSVNGKRLVAGQDRSVGQILSPNGVLRKFDYTVTKELQPTMTVLMNGTSREIVWDAESMLIAKDGIWSYRVTPAKTKGYNASIERTDEAGETEMWFFDRENSREIEKNRYGAKKTTHWFTSGKLAGQTRSIDGEKGATKFLYDEDGLLAGKRLTDGSLLKINRNKEAGNVMMTLTAGDSKVLKTVTISEGKKWTLSTEDEAKKKTQYTYDKETGLLTIIDN